MATRLKKWPTDNPGYEGEKKAAPAEKTEAAEAPAPKKKFSLLKSRD